MNITLTELRQIYENVLLSLMRPGYFPKVEVSFYPYVGINNKIRLRDEKIEVKISDLLQDAPREIHQSLAEILLRKLYRKRVPALTNEIFRKYIKQSEIRERSIKSRKERGRKIIKGSQGEIYDLEEIFALLNQIYFQNAIRKPQLSWSAHKTYRILGHHDPTHQAIVISKSLDDPQVPRFVVEYVVYHEMLHIKHPARFENGRRYHHTADFRRDEREFAFFADAEDWIEKNAHNLKSKVKRRGK